MQLAPAHWAEYRPGRFLSVWLVVTLIQFARVPTFWLTGEFVAEDGWVFFAGAFNAPWTQSWLQPYAGYFHTAPRILAELWSGLPLVWQPYAYAGSGLAIDALILSLFCLPHFRRLVPSDGQRLGIVAVLALAQNAENLGLVLGVNWYLGFGLALLLVMTPPSGWAGRVAMTVGAVLAVWSTPAAFVLVPWLGWGVWRGRERFGRIWGAIVLSNLVVVAGLVMALRLQTPGRTGAFTGADMVIAAERLVLRGWLGTGLLGEALSSALAGTGVLGWLGLAMAVVLLICGWRLRAEPWSRPLAGLMLVAVAMIALSLTRTLYVASAADTALPLHERYLTAPTLLLSVVVLAALARTRSSRVFWRVWLVECGLLLVSLPQLNHWARPAVAFHLRDFVADIERFERAYVLIGQPGSLYVPADVPYWGPVLESAGGLRVSAEADPTAVLAPMVRLGGWRLSDRPSWIEHEGLGALQFDGVEGGRVWFRDEAGRELFTSELLQPRFWSMQPTGFVLIDPTVP